MAIRCVFEFGVLLIPERPGLLQRVERSRLTTIPNTKPLTASDDVPFDAFLLDA